MIGASKTRKKKCEHFMLVEGPFIKRHEIRKLSQQEKHAMEKNSGGKEGRELFQGSGVAKPHPQWTPGLAKGLG